MARWSGEVEFEFIGDEEEGSFIATKQVVPQLTNLLARGEIEQAVLLYEDCESSVASELLDGVNALSSISKANLGEMFLLARDFSNAAKVFEIARRWADAARTFEQAGDFAGAAQSYERQGEHLKAAAAWDRAGAPERAAELYAKLEPSEAEAEFHARRQRYWHAALVYHKLGNVRLEVSMLRMVPLDDPQRIPAVKRLGDLLERHGYVESSAQLLVDTVKQVRSAQTDAKLLADLCRRLEVLGRSEQAARVRDFAGKALAGRQGMQPALSAGSERDESGSVATGPVGPVEPTPHVDAYARLKAIPIFGSLALQDMRDLHRGAEEVKFADGATVIEQGQLGAGLSIILEGAVHVVRIDDSARQVSLAHLKAGSYVGELSLIDDSPASARVVADGAVQVLRISPERFQQFLYSHEAAALRIFKLFTRTLAERLRQANQRA